VKAWIFGLAMLFGLCGCKNKSFPEGVATAVDRHKARIYEMADVDKDLKGFGIQLGSSREDLQSFFKSHPNYQVCQDTGHMLVARMRNSDIDRKVHDQYIFAVYRADKIFNLEVGPPEFSVGNLPAYCR
jgi:hypothetical protein